MARQPKVEIDGNEMKNILEVRYGVRAAKDRDGAPTRQVLCDGIMVRRVADDAVDIAEWAADANEANRKAGAITFVDANGLTMKKLEFKKAYVRQYSVDYVDDGDHVEEMFIIEPEIISLGGEEHDFDWKNK